MAFVNSMRKLTSVKTLWTVCVSTHLRLTFALTTVLMDTKAPFSHALTSALAAVEALLLLLLFVFNDGVVSAAGARLLGSGWALTLTKADRTVGVPALVLFTLTHVQYTLVVELLRLVPVVSI